uniref:Uncharacterized protein n=1 Tax=Ciona savignyi TaxID=51511 RepID=H2YJV3_CIOSA
MNLIAEDPNAIHTFYSPAFTGLLDFPQQLSYQLCRVSSLVPTDITFSTTISPGKKLTFQVEVPASTNTATIAISKSKTTAHGVVYI